MTVDSYGDNEYIDLYEKLIINGTELDVPCREVADKYSLTIANKITATRSYIIDEANEKTFTTAIMGGSDDYGGADTDDVFGVIFSDKYPSLYARNCKSTKLAKRDIYRQIDINYESKTFGKINDEEGPEPRTNVLYSATTSTEVFTAAPGTFINDKGNSIQDPVPIIITKVAWNITHQGLHNLPMKIDKEGPTALGNSGILYALGKLNDEPIGFPLFVTKGQVLYLGPSVQSGNDGFGRGTWDLTHHLLISTFDHNHVWDANQGKMIMAVPKKNPGGFRFEYTYLGFVL